MNIKIIKKIIRESINEHDFDEFDKKSSYIDSDGHLIGHHSANQESAAKLAYDELKEAGVNVSENYWHDDDPTVLFIIKNEGPEDNKWLSPYYGTDIAKMEGWRDPKISNFITDVLKKYRLYSEWANGETLVIRSF